MPFKRRCPTCGSRQWHKEPSSGMIVCSEGHILESYRNESSEVAFASHVAQQRYLKKNKEKKEKSKADPRLYHGSRGRFLYFQCLQVLLRRQVSALVKLWDLPYEFEIVCRDVWALNLCLLSQAIHGDANMVEDIPIPASVTKSQYSDDEESQQSDEDRSGRDSELEKLLPENSCSSSEDEDEDEEHWKVQFETDKQQSGKTRRKVRGEEGPPSTVVILMIACWVLRIPVTCQDFSRAIEAYELPYLDGVLLLPVDLTSHLTKHAKRSLSPHHAPKTLALYTLSRRLARKLNERYGIVIPEINAAPILWRAVRAMGGTPMLYMLTKRLSQVFSLQLVLHPSNALNTSEGKKESHENAPVEITFVAIIVIMLKMVYGLDSKERSPQIPDDPACSLPRLNDFLANLRSLDETDEYKYDSRKVISIGDLEEEEIDDYLEFCERALLGTNQRNQVPEEIVNDRFPLQGGTNRMEARSSNHNTQGRRTVPMTATSARPGGRAVRPGKEYWIWSGRDVLGVLPSELWEIVKRGGQWGGVDEDYICELVEKYEERLSKCQRLRAESEAMAT